MSDIVKREATLPERIASVQEELADLNAQAAEALNEDEQTSGSMELVTTRVDPEVIKRNLANQRTAAAKLQKRIESKADELGKLMREQVELVQRQAREMEAQAREMLDPLRQQLERLEEAVWTVNLYLGRQEQIVTLREGTPAPPLEPIQVRQMVLSMDEECAVASEQGGIDYKSIAEFDAWLVEDDAHIEQVIPEKKAVVALVPRARDTKLYEGMTMAQMAEAKAADNHTYFLIRNGDQLYRIWTEFSIGMHLVPREDEFTRYFTKQRFDYKTHKHVEEVIEPGGRDWFDAQERAERRQRDFMRVALILEGLLHRTTVFHPHHPQGVGFLDHQHHKDGRVRFIMDAERTLGTGREPFRDWLTRLNSQLRPGMRIVGNFRSEGWRDANSEDERIYGEGPRVRPKGAQAPRTGVIYRIEEREGRALIIRYRREGERWDPSHRRYVEDERPGRWYVRGAMVPYKQRASARLFPEDEFIIPFDLVTEEEVRGYLASRVERQEYKTMFPVLKAVLRAKRAERELEAPFHTMLAGVLARENGVSVADAQDEVPDLVRWYKLANRIHRPLMSGADARPELELPEGMEPDDVDLVLIDPATGNADESHPVKQIVAEHRRRLRDRDGSTNDDEARTTLLRAHPQALCIARLRKGGYIVVEAADERNVFTHEWEYSLRGLREGEPRERRYWTLVGSRPSRWIVLHEDERWREWDFAASLKEHLTGPEEQQLIAFAISEADPDRLLGVTYREPREGPATRRYEAWVATRAGALPDETKLLTERISEPQPEAHDIDWARRDGSLRFWLRTHGNLYSWIASDEKPPWSGHEMHDRYWKLLYEVDGAVERLRERVRLAGEMQRRRRALENVVDAAHRSIIDQWEKASHDKAFAKFMEEFGDEELWEGHLKAHPIKGYPYGRGRRHNETPAVVRSLRRLVQAGIEPWGLTVAEGWARAVELGMPLADPDFKQPYTGVPDAIADLRYVRPQGDDALELEAGDDDGEDL